MPKLMLSDIQGRHGIHRSGTDKDMYAPERYTGALIESLRSIKEGHFDGVRVQGLADAITSHFATQIPPGMVHYLVLTNLKKATSNGHKEWHFDINNGPSEGLKLLAEKLPTSNTKELNIETTVFDKQSLKVLADAVEASKVERITIENSDISLTDLTMLMPALVKCKSIILSDNLIDDTAVPTLLDMIAEGKVETLDLNGNNFTLKGLEELAEGLEKIAGKSHLKRIEITDNLELKNPEDYKMINGRIAAAIGDQETVIKLGYSQEQYRAYKAATKTQAASDSAWAENVETGKKIKRDDYNHPDAIGTGEHLSLLGVFEKKVKDHLGDKANLISGVEYVSSTGSEIEGNFAVKVNCKTPTAILHPLVDVSRCKRRDGKDSYHRILVPESIVYNLLQADRGKTASVY